MESRVVTASRARPRWIVWTLWCGAAEVIGMFAAAGAAIASTQVFGEPSTLLAALAVMLVAAAGGAIEGFAVGAIQCRLLRRWLPSLSSRRYVGATVTVAVSAWILGMLPSTIASLLGATGDGGQSTLQPPIALIVVAGAAGGAVAGAIFGGAQAWALRGVVKRPSTWVLANVLAWTAALAVIMVGATTPNADWSVAAVLGAGAITGMAAGLVLGAITGLFLPRLIPTATQPASDVPVSVP